MGLLESHCLVFGLEPEMERCMFKSWWEPNIIVKNCSSHCTAWKWNKKSPSPPHLITASLIDKIPSGTPLRYILKTGKVCYETTVHRQLGSKLSLIKDEDLYNKFMVANLFQIKILFCNFTLLREHRHSFSVCGYVKL